MDNKNFQKAIKKLLKVEGGYANHKNDRGGETYKGIARKSWSQWEGWSIVDDIKNQDKNWLKNLSNNSRLHELVQEFYYKNFWKFDGLLSEKISYEIFDSAINHGMFRGVQLAQQGYNICFPLATILSDGRFGAITCEAFNSQLPKYERAIYNAINGEQYILYKNIVRNDSSQQVFFRGWVAHRLGN